ncbi:MAG: 30S ribosomal protein S12 methylthiotransferase RimO [Clostridiales bacterium]|jgi:ribosomal protein S12 methylthiotransferase|nr:30S ribosomal protein S12 methylthiotransferase RimO [Clostridiales bacterium]
MKDTKVALISLGCDKNTVDSEILLGQLARQGAVFTPELELADVIIINTCGFLQEAVAESREEIARAVAYKTAGSCQKVIVTGCAAMRYKAEFLAIPGVDEVLAQPDFALYDLRIPSTPRHYAYLRIAEGCDKNCTYCTIPQIRGSYRSRELDGLLNEARRLASLGVRELILVAQDTTLYGTDLYGGQKLHELLAELSQIDGVKWLRLLYCYPEHIYPEMLAEMAQNPKVLPYIDLPIQHSVDKILRTMGRKSSEEMLRAKIDEIRAAMPEVVLRTTLITGFPGENKKDFQALCNFIEDIRFDNLGVFAYSREEGTPADKLDGHLPEKTKAARRDRLMQLQQRISAENLAFKAGSILEVVVEGFEDGVYFARSYALAPDIDGLIFIPADKPLKIGDFVHVRIIETYEYDMLGEYYESAK